MANIIATQSKGAHSGKTLPITHVHVTAEQRDFLNLIIHTDAASSLGGRSGVGNAIQWCIDACMKIEKLYGIDACFVANNDIRLPENQMKD